MASELESIAAQLRNGCASGDETKKHEQLNCMEAVWFEEALGFKDMPIGVNAHELAKEKLRDILSERGELGDALQIAEKWMKHVIEDTEWADDDYAKKEHSKALKELKTVRDAIQSITKQKTNE